MSILNAAQMGTREGLLALRDVLAAEVLRTGVATLAQVGGQYRQVLRTLGDKDEWRDGLEMLRDRLAMAIDALDGMDEPEANEPDLRMMIPQLSGQLRMTLADLGSFPAVVKESASDRFAARVAAANAGTPAA